ncbi:hypothetical protein PPERSA_01919 [Pseudocohnilembus persalinus]|uniref:Uncharacterized protein n=1 Tax=Pseudocohnilembus persalinus TaxID=266149 RepID=A0A0V0R487_PSEPJ|nr:hypothetical protein PPERSA_01919 [Pseudocohnilembus persalinus]|eukprot:KRX09032.1 hypothetical protein PPERSA_01919 [Pseudocohnilembus persalinus]
MTFKSQDLVIIEYKNINKIQQQFEQKDFENKLKDDIQIEDELQKCGDLTNNKIRKIDQHLEIDFQAQNLSQDLQNELQIQDKQNSRPNEKLNKGYNLRSLNQKEEGKFQENNNNKNINLMKQQKEPKNKLKKFQLEKQNKNEDQSNLSEQQQLDEEQKLQNQKSNNNFSYNCQELDQQMLNNLFEQFLKIYQYAIKQKVPKTRFHYKFYIQDVFYIPLIKFINKKNMQFKYLLINLTLNIFKIEIPFAQSNYKVIDQAAKGQIATEIHEKYVDMLNKKKNVILVLKAISQDRIGTKLFRKGKIHDLIKLCY